MKSILSVIIGVAALLATVSAQAQTYASPDLIASPGTYANAAGSAATNYGKVMDVRKQSKVAVQITQTYSTAGTAPCIYYFQRSVDGINYDFPANSMNGQAVGIAGTGNTPVTVITNLDTLGCGFIRLAWVTNSSASGTSLTNLSVKYGLKIQAP